MAWWAKLSRGHGPTSLDGAEYRVTTTLYSPDGKRQVEVLELHSGEAYLIESELVEGATFKNRHGDAPVGPFKSVKKAQDFIVATTWFTGEQG